jgi:hypothetical protein
MTDFQRPSYLPELHLAVRPPFPDYTPSLPTVEQPDVPHAEQPDRVKLTGRLVYDPKLHEFPNGGRRVTLTVAEHLEDGSTRYHSVYSTKRFAEGIARKGLKQGDLVELVGQKQRVVRTVQGEEKEVDVIYAYGVKPK